MDMDWYYKCNSILECYQYFDRLEPGDGRRTAIYDVDEQDFLWIDEDSLGNEDRLNGIVYEAMQGIRQNR